VPWDEPGATALVVPIPEAEHAVGRWYREHSAVGRQGMPPHITLLVPFVPAALCTEGVENRVRAALATHVPFDFWLDRVKRFPGGVLYLAPQPAVHFVELTEALVAEFPDYRPYDGEHDEVIPHATVAISDDGALLDRITRALEPALPIACRASSVELVERRDDGRWSLRRTYPLGRE
jgi:2'-5' RNA ligase